MNHYQVLGVPTNASQDEISRAFKKLAIKYHPDKSNDPRHHELFIEVQKAYETLRSVESRKVYDRANNIKSTRSTTNTSTSTSTNTSSNNPYYTNININTSNRGFSFSSNTNFSWGHFHLYFTTDDLLEKQKQAQMEKIRRETEIRNAKWAADAERERLREELEKTKREHIEKLRQMKRDQEAREAREEARKSREEARKFQEENEARSRHFEANMYNQRKKQAYRAQWSEPLRAFDGDIFTRRDKRGDVSDPIVVEENDLGAEYHTGEEFGDEDDGYQRNQGHGDYVGKTESYTHQYYDSPLPDESDLAGPRPESVDIPGNSFDEPIILDDSRQPSEPAPDPVPEQVPQATDPVPEQAPQAPEPAQAPVPPGPAQAPEPPRSPNKRAKVFSLDDLSESLGPDIGTDDLNSLRETLPFTDHNPKSKRPKTAEYSNGSSKAETLHTPVNKKPVRGFAAKRSPGLTMLEFNASSLVNSILPPQPPRIQINHAITREYWDTYLQHIVEYQQKFLEYKRRMLKYQKSRLQKDVEHFNVYNTNPEAFAVYLKCIEQDSVASQALAESGRVFSQTMREYQQNYNWVRVAGLVE